MIEELY